VDYDALKTMLRSRADVEVGNPPSLDEIDAVVRDLGELPDDYRAFLAEFGWVSFGPYEIFGAGPGVPKYLDVVHMAISEWTDAGLPRDLIPIMNDGGGNLSCIERSTDSARSEVVLWDHDTGSRVVPTPRALTFAAFLAALLSDPSD
jgi:hypothetical protein